MSLTEDALARIEAALGPQEADPAALASFRREFPGLSFTRCDLSDLGVEAPFRQYPRFNLYLVDAHDHCSRLTSDLERATGVVIATKPLQVGA